MAKTQAAPAAKTDAPAAGKPLISDAKLQQLYTNMLQCRALRERLASLTAEHGQEMHCFPQGDEAMLVGTLADIDPSDTVLAARMDPALPFLRNVPLETIVAQFGRSAGTRDHQDASSRALLSPTAFGSFQAGIASGIAFANHAAKAGDLVIVISDSESAGASAWQEALEFAGTQRLPIVYVLQYGYGTPRNKQRAAKSPEDYGIPAIPVDADDVVAVYRVAHEATKRARNGGGPTVIECRPYRVGSNVSIHTAPTKARPTDALIAMERFLTNRGFPAETWKQVALKEFTRRLDMLTTRKKGKSAGPQAASAITFKT